MKRLIFVFFCVIYKSMLIFASQYYFRHYQNENGLSNNTVFSCMQDSQGFMWFGTKDGLNKFDGIRFKTFRLQEYLSTNNISDNVIIGLWEDHDQCIWIGTFNGIYYYDIKSNEFHILKDKDTPINGLIFDIKVDANNIVWFTTAQGIYTYDKNKNALKCYSSETHFIPYSICITPEQDIWIGSIDGNIYKFNQANQTFQGFPILSHDELSRNIKLSKICYSSRYGLIISTNTNGIRSLDPVSKEVKVLFTMSNDKTQMRINDILLTPKQILWVGTNAGLYKYDFQKGLSQPIKNSISNPYSLSDNGIRALYEDTEGGLWIGTFYGGINYLPNEDTPFEKYLPSSLSGHIHGRIIRALCKDDDGNIWIGSEDGELCKLDPKTQIIINYPFKRNIQSLLVDNHKLWIGTFDDGLFIMDILTGHMVHLEHKDLKNSSIVTFLKTSKHDIYVGTTAGIYRYDRQKQSFCNEKDMAYKSFIHCMYEDHKGTIWFGTYGDGLYQYHPNERKYTHYQYSPDKPNGISSNYITSIYEDSKGTLWLATEGSGFCKINKTGTFKRYTIKDEMYSNIICNICEDSKGTLWISSTGGLMKFNSETNERRIYRTSDGLVNNHFSYNAQCTDNLGNIYLGTIRGMVAFNPLKLKERNFTPPIYITEFSVTGNQNKMVEKDKSILNTKEITLPYTQSSFSIYFVAPTYTTPQANRYRYILEGNDQDWTYINNYREIYYTNISPGKYTLKVAIMDQNHRWDTHVASLNITITPPFWASSFAYLTYGILFFIIITSLYSNYTKKRKREQEQKRKELENQKEKEIYNAKISFFTNITHEVRTPLTLIQIPLDKVIETEHFSPSVTENLLIMKRNVNRLLDLTNQLLDFRKTEMDMLKLNFVHTDISLLLSDTISRFTPSAEEKKMKLELIQPQHPVYINLDQEIVTKIISNLLTNALKYSTDQIVVSLEDQSENNSNITIRVNSNGATIPPSLKEKIFEPFYQISHTSHNTPKGTGLGLSLARSLAELHQGKLYLDIQVSTMNSFVLELPNIQEKPKEISVSEEKEESCPIGSYTKGRTTILIVDDEKEMLKFVANELSSEYNILAAFNGKEALDILKKEQINLVVSDVLMPVMDGYTLCTTLKSSSDYCHIPIILLTASAGLNARITGLESGADGYLEKPFTMKLLKEQITNIIKNKELACKNFINSPLSNYKAIAINKMDEEFMKGLHSTLLKNISDSSLNVETLAQIMNISASTLYRKVKVITDLSPNEYIRIYRLKKGAEMLMNNEYKINEVSYLVGFSSPSYFATSFQKQFNISPSEFVKQQQNK